MTTVSNDRLALIYGLGAVGLWSTVATAFKLSLAHVSPLLLVTVASITSWIFLGALMLVTGQWRELAGLTRIKVLRLLLLGLLNPALYYFVLFAAYDRLPAQEAMALNLGMFPVVPRDSMNLSDDDFAAVGSEIAPITLQTQIHLDEGDWLEERFQIMLSN